METESEDQAEEAARDILSQGVHSVLVKRGTNGSLLIDRDGDVNLQPIFEVEKVCSEPASGAFAAGMLARPWHMQEAAPL